MISPVALPSLRPVTLPGKLAKTLSTIDPKVAAILQRALSGEELSESEGLVLFDTRGPELEALVQTADRLRARAVGNRGTFVTTRNINFTNVCYMGCRFCNFAKRREDAGASQ